MFKKFDDIALDKAIEIYEKFPVQDGNVEDKRYRMACAIRAAINEINKENLNYSETFFSENE